MLSPSLTPYKSALIDYSLPLLFLLCCPSSPSNCRPPESSPKDTRRPPRLEAPLYLGLPLLGIITRMTGEGPRSDFRSSRIRPTSRSEECSRSRRHELSGTERALKTVDDHSPYLSVDSMSSLVLSSLRQVSADGHDRVDQQEGQDAGRHDRHRNKGAPAPVLQRNG